MTTQEPPAAVATSSGRPDRPDPGVEITAHPGRVAAGAVVLLRARLPRGGTYEVMWEVQGPVYPPGAPDIVLHGTTTVPGNVVDYDPDVPVLANLDTRGMVPGAWIVRAVFTQLSDGPDRGAACVGETDPFEVTERPLASGDDLSVRLRRAAVEPTPDQALWVAIRSSTTALGFRGYRAFLDGVVGEQLFGRGGRRADPVRRHGPGLAGVDPYELLQVATAVFMMSHCGVDPRHDLDFHLDLGAESRRLDRDVVSGQLEAEYRQQLELLPADGGLEVLPYLALIRGKLGDVAVTGDADRRARILDGILRERLVRPCLIDLVWSFWMECAGLPQAIDAITWRFQNRSSGPAGRDPLAGLDVDPLRPLNDLIWGLVQNARAGHLLTPARRIDEYEHALGVGIRPRGGTADPRTRFMESFHHLLALCAEFYRDDDNMTIRADAFGLLNALREVHLMLSEGSGNAWRGITWTTRQEMLVEQYVLSRPEMREFLPSRTMVAYPEDWMGPLETMNRLQGWSDVSILHYLTLATAGEQLLVGIRFGDWTQVQEADRAANWARYWRPEVQGYANAHRAVTGVDPMRNGRATASIGRGRQRQG